MNTKQQIILSLSRNLLCFLPTVLKNIIAFNRDEIIFYILISFDMTKEDKEQMKEFKTYDKCSLVFKKISNETRQRLESVDYSNLNREDAMSLRLYLSELGISDRALYLDLDILCMGRFSELFDTELTPLNGNLIAACPDVYLNYRNILTNGKCFNDKLPKEVNQLPYDNINTFYFNSGVLLIDVDKLNQDNIWIKNISQLQTYKVFPDQDFLNVLHFGQVTELPYKYNYLAYHLINNRMFFEYFNWNANCNDWYSVVTYNDYGKKIDTYHYKNSLDTFKKVKPVFLHFAGKQKQWNNTATEFVEFFNIFKAPLHEVLRFPIEYYEAVVDELWHKFGYFPILNDYLASDIKSISPEYIKTLNLKEKWSFNPILLNSKIFTRRGLCDFINNALTTSRREKLNKKYASRFL